MNQRKIGIFLKTLRREKRLTQEALAEIFNVSRRTVTRWETGTNMPDLSILVGIADFYNVDLKEIFNGERKNDNMNTEIKETLMQAAEYNNMEKQRDTKIILAFLIIGAIALIINQIFLYFDFDETFLVGFIEGLTAGLTFGSILFAILYVVSRLTKISKNRKLNIIKGEKNEK